MNIALLVIWLVVAAVLWYAVVISYNDFVDAIPFLFLSLAWPIWVPFVFVYEIAVCLRFKARLNNTFRANTEYIPVDCEMQTQWVVTEIPCDDGRPFMVHVKDAELLWKYRCMTRAEANLHANKMNRRERATLKGRP